MSLLSVTSCPFFFFPSVGSLVLRPSPVFWHRAGRENQYLPFIVAWGPHSFATWHSHKGKSWFVAAAVTSSWFWWYCSWVLGEGQGMWHRAGTVVYSSLCFSTCSYKICLWPALAQWLVRVEETVLADLNERICDYFARVWRSETSKGEHQGLDAFFPIPTPVKASLKSPLKTPVYPFGRMIFKMKAEPLYCPA